MKRQTHLIEALTAFTVIRHLGFVDRQTGKIKDQAPKQHHYLGRKTWLATANQIILLGQALLLEQYLNDKEALRLNTKTFKGYTMIYNFYCKEKYEQRKEKQATSFLF